MRTLPSTIRFVGNIVVILIFIGVTMYKSEMKKERVKEKRITKLRLTEAEEALKVAAYWTLKNAGYSEEEALELAKEGGREESGGKVAEETSSPDVAKVGGAKPNTRKKEQKSANGPAPKNAVTFKGDTSVGGGGAKKASTKKKEGAKGTPPGVDLGAQL